MACHEKRPKTMRLFRRKEKEGNHGFFNRLKEGLAKTRSGFTGRLDQLLFGSKEINETILEDLEEILFTSDLGVATTQELVDTVREGVTRKELDQPEKLKSALKEQMLTFLEVPEPDHRIPGPAEPLVIMVIG